MVAGPIGCGVLEHEEACLCDVDIDARPLPKIADVIKDFTRDVAMAREVAELRGYSAPWTNETTLAYLCDVQKFWDVYKEQLAEGHIEYKTLESVPPFVWDSGVSLQQSWARVRELLMYCLSRFDDPSLDIIRHLNVSPKQFMASISNGHFLGEWTEADMVLCDELLMQEVLVAADVYRRLNISDDQLKSLRKYWEVRRSRKWSIDNPAKVMMHNLARNTTLSPKEIIRMVQERYNFTYSRGAVTKYRKRIVLQSNTGNQRGHS